MNKNICCILDTCVLSDFIDNKILKNDIDDSKEIRLELLDNINNSSLVIHFILPTIVLHELALGIYSKSKDTDLSEISNILKYYLQSYFNNKLKIIPLNHNSAYHYCKIYYDNLCNNKNRSKNKIDSLIVAQSSYYAFSNKYSEVWLLTEDNYLKKYRVENIKIYSLREASEHLGLNTFFTK